MTAFVHLRVHTEYSLADSLVRIDALVDAVAGARMPAVAVTDQGNVAALVKFYRTALSAGIKPVIGADVAVVESAADKDPCRLTLLCRNLVGFKQLSALLTECHRQAAEAGRPVLPKAWLAPDRLDGLIALSGGLAGDLGRALTGTHPERALTLLDEWRALFPERFYVELQRLGRAGEPEYLERAVELAASRGVPVVATNDVCFLTPAEYEAHEARVCIAQGTTLDASDRVRSHTDRQYLKTPQEMAELFADLPEALEQSVEIAKRCSFELELGRVFLPRFSLESGEPADDDAVRKLLLEHAEAGLESRAAAGKANAAPIEVYRERLTRELGVIGKMGYDGYFLIVADFIKWAREHAIPVGPGRGSGAGSLVAYALGITNLDPIEHDLLFERFLNPERVSLPDFDIDFCIEGRDRVIDYVAARYGRERVSQIVTYGTMAARAVVRDVGRVLGLPYGYVDRIAKLIPFELGITLDRAVADDEELRRTYESDDEVRGLIDLARKLEGLARNVGTHAGGVVIAPQPLVEFMPLFVEAGGSPLSQLDKDDLEAVGLIKFDFLGLKTLTIIDKAVATIERQNGAKLDLDAIPIDDPATYRLLQRCQTTAVFQLESRGMRDLVKRLQPDRFEDLVAILALFRPGPLQSGMVEEFINRKHGRQSGPIDYLHPSLEATLKPTYGVILYQEQVMQIAQVLAGYSLGGADLLRRAMGKKKPEEMAKQRAVFLEGATERGIDTALASRIFDLMEKFAGYGFNKSHSVAYALIAYQTAWLKAHYPEAFMAAVMTADMDNTDKLVVLKDECTQLGLVIDPPNVNASAFEFTAAGAGRISYGLGAIKGVGQGAVEAIVSEREANGRYKSLLDLCRRVDQQKIGRRVLEALARAGALDGLGMNRATLINAIPGAIELAERAQHANAAGQGGLFGADEADTDLEQVVTPVREWTKREILNAERESLGLFLTGHPFDEFARHCKEFTNGPLANVQGPAPPEGMQYAFRKDVTVAGAVMEVRRRGNRVALQLDDNTERIEVTLFEEIFANSKHLITRDAVLVVDGQLRYDDFLSAWRVTARRVRSVDEAIEEYASRLQIYWDGESLGAELVPQLKQTLAPFRNGKCLVSVRYRCRTAEASLTLGDAWAVRPTRELRDRLTRLLGEERFSIHYPKHFV